MTDLLSIRIENRVFKTIAGQSTATNIVASLLTRAIGLITIVAGLWFLFQILSGGLSILGAVSDRSRLQEGKDKIVNGIFGLIIVIGAVFVIVLISSALGIPDILNIQQLVIDIGTNPI